MKKGPFTRLTSKVVYQNPWIKVCEDSVVRPDGSEGIFGTFDIKDGVTIAALTPEREILLVREYKYGFGDYTLACISGGIDENETHIETARRELREETGAVSDSWTYLGPVVSLTTYADFTEHIYVAQNVAIKNEQQTDDGEVVEVIRMPFGEALQKVRQNEIIHDMAVIAILRTRLLLNQ